MTIVEMILFLLILLTKSATVDLKDSTSFSIPRTPKEHHMTFHDDDYVDSLSGKHFSRIYDAIREVAWEIGDVSPTAVADHMACVVSGLRGQRACA